MKNYYVIVNSDKDPGFAVTNRVKDVILALGGNCRIGHVGTGIIRGRYTDADQIPQGTEAVLVIGGDGTLIQAARDLKDRELPMMGINMGTLGYLSEVETAAIEETIGRLFAGEYFIEDRMRIKGVIRRQGESCYEDQALNDIVLSRQGSPRVLRYRIQVNGQLLYDFDSDGILVSTPTGSTAYNLSAGGPIVSPEARLFVVTPICAHSLNSRSVVLPENSRIEISVEQDREPEAGWLTAFDGVTYDRIRPGDSVQIAASDKSTKLIKLSKVSFLETLQRKMQNH